MIRSVTVVVLGYLVFGVSAVLLFQLSGVDPHGPGSSGFKLFATIYGLVFAVAGGVLVALGSRSKPRRHLGVLAVLMATGVGAQPKT